jgi:hypothetical protein
MGGISIAVRGTPSEIHLPIADFNLQNHPVTDLPAFFIHPCNTGEALDEICHPKPRSPEEYLLVWLGLVGPLVGLHVTSLTSLAIVKKVKGEAGAEVSFRDQGYHV